MPPIPVSGSLPDDYQEVLYWRVTGKPTRMITIQILALISLRGVQNGPEIKR